MFYEHNSLTKKRLCMIISNRQNASFYIEKQAYRREYSIKKRVNFSVEINEKFL